MRKLKMVTTMNPDTFQSVVKVVMVDNGVVTELASHDVEISRYTPAQKAMIDVCNQALRDNGHKTMTEEEADHVTGKHLEKLAEPTDEELQRLAGFAVNKTVTYFEP